LFVKSEVCTFEANKQSPLLSYLDSEDQGFVCTADFAKGLLMKYLKKGVFSNFYIYIYQKKDITLYNFI